MTDGVTYAGALAACVARWGCYAPSTKSASRSLPTLMQTHWPTNDDAGAITLYESAGVVWLETAHADDLRASVYPLAGSADMAPVPLPDALGAADAFRRIHATTPTKGP